MRWTDIRKAYPGQWLVIEALHAHSDENHHRMLDEIAVVETCVDGVSAMQAYRRLHRQHPEREFYFVHTDREQLEILERQWLGIRRGHAVPTQG